MDFDFSDDQQSLRDAVRKWVDKGYSFERRRAIVAAGGFDRAAYGELAELGLTALTVPEAHDGLGQGAIDAMVAMEELGRGIVLEPLAQTFVATSVLSHHAPAAVQAAWLPRIASGEALVVLAHQERKARYRLDVCEAKAAQTPTGHALTATKSIVPAGDQADAFIVPAQLDGRIALFLVERSACGVTPRGYGTQDGSRAAELVLDKVQVGADALERLPPAGLLLRLAQHGQRQVQCDDLRLRPALLHRRGRMAGGERRVRGQDAEPLGGGPFAPDEETMHGEDPDVVFRDEDWSFTLEQAALVEAGYSHAFSVKSGLDIRMSAAGTARSTSMKKSRALGRRAVEAGRRSGTAYFEWCVPEKGPDGRPIIEMPDDMLVELMLLNHPRRGRGLREDFVAEQLDRDRRDALRAYGGIDNDEALDDYAVIDMAAMHAARAEQPIPEECSPPTRG